MVIEKIVYGEESSVRLEDFRYAKPRVELTVSIQEGDDPTEAFDKTVALVRNKLRYEEQRIFKTFKERDKKLHP